MLLLASVVQIRRRQCAQSQEKLESLDKGSCEVPLEKSPFEYMSVKTIPFAVVTELVVDAQNNYVHVHLKPGLDMSESTANSMIPGTQEPSPNQQALPHAVHE